MATWYVPSVILRPQLVMRSINPNETWRPLILVSAAKELMQGENITRAFYMCRHSATNYGWGYCFHKLASYSACFDWQRRELVLQNGHSLASQCQHLGFLWVEKQPSDHERYASSLGNYKKSPLFWDQTLAWVAAFHLLWVAWPQVPIHLNHHGLGSR